MQKNEKNIKKAIDKSEKNGIMKTLASERHIIPHKSRKKSKNILKKGLTRRSECDIIARLSSERVTGTVIENRTTRDTSTKLKRVRNISSILKRRVIL